MLRRLLGSPPAIEVRDRVRDAYAAFTTRPLALYGAAAVRIGCAGLFFLYLFREMPEVQQLWGPNSAWTPEMDHALADGSPWAGWERAWYTLLAQHSSGFVWVFYLASLAVCLLLTLGWRTRAMSVAFLIVVTAFDGRAILITDGGDNVLLLLAFYLAMTACGRVWSLDARRYRYGQAARGTRQQLVTILHNCGVVLIGYQVCVVYAAAAFAKIQGSMWQDGTALHYALHLWWFAPWPGLSDWVASHHLFLVIGAYATVLSQMAVPFVLFTKHLKYVVLAILLGMHLSIMLLLGLPIFSLAMLIGDAIFLPDGFYQGAQRLAVQTYRQLRPQPAARELETIVS